MEGAFSCCDKVWVPCVRCFATDRLDFSLDGEDWRFAFSEAGGCFGKCCSSFYQYWRLILLALQLALVIHSEVAWVEYYGGKYGYWYTKLTHWGAMLLLSYLAFAAFTAFRARASPRDGDELRTPWFVSVTWALGATNPVIAFMLFIMFWVLVYTPGDTIHFETISMHGGNVVITLLDLVSTRQPYYIQHVYMPMLFAMMYLFFTYIYYAAGGTNEEGNSYIYKSLDWSDPSSVGRLSAIILFVAVPLAYILFWVLAALRKKIRGCVEGSARAREVGGSQGEA